MVSTPFAEAQSGDEGLDLDAHRIALAGPIEDLHYPTCCPHCVAPASEALTIGKVFFVETGDGTPNGRAVVEAHPLFCGSCIARHRAETITPTSGDAMKTVLFSDQMLPAVFSALGGLFLLNMAGRVHGKAFLIMAGIAGAFFLISCASWRDAWSRTRWKRVPAQTATSRAFDFGHD